MTIDREIISEMERVNVGPWKNKREFEGVYEWLFGEAASVETKKMACKRMTLWKIRRVDLTPATILSTLVIVKTQIIDEMYPSNASARVDLKTQYTSAITKFLNYMSSVVQSKELKTMYGTAKELGIESFLVDLRHLCAHGYDMPSMDVLRSVSNYCLDWLKEVYWDHEKENITNVDVKAVQEYSEKRLRSQVKLLFQTYDTISKAIEKGCVTIADAKRNLKSNEFAKFEKFLTSNKEHLLFTRRQIVLHKISKAFAKGKQVEKAGRVYIDSFLEMSHFFESAVKKKERIPFKKYIYTITMLTAIAFQSKKKGRILAKKHSKLMRTTAKLGLISDLYAALLMASENCIENENIRKGSAFWASQIAENFHLNQFQSEANENVTPSKKLPYDLLDLKRASVGPMDEPVVLSLPRQYMMERIIHSNELTNILVKKSLPFVDPPLSKEKQNLLDKLINIYSGNLNSETENSEQTKIYTLKDDVLNKSITDESSNIKSDNKKYGIWSLSTVPAKEWQTCAFGILPASYSK